MKTEINQNEMSRNVFLETEAASDLFADAVRPAKHSPEFWEALVALGGTPERAAPHIPEMTEAEVAAEMAEARGRVAEGVAAPLSSRLFSERPDVMRSNFGTRLGERR